MVSADTRSISALSRFRWGTVMLWVGVLVWVPFIILRATGFSPSLLWFLPFHLIGVIGGSRLRASARKELDHARAEKRLYRTVGHGLILLGILAWLPGIVQNLTAQKPLDVSSILPIHLTGLLGGAAVLVAGAILHRQKE